MGAFAFFGRFGQTLAFGRANAEATKHLRANMAQKLLKQEVGYFDNNANALGALTTKLGGCAIVPLLITQVWGEVATLSLYFILCLSGDRNEF